MATAQQILAGLGVTMAQARNFIYENVDKPALIYTIAKSVGLTSDNLGEIVGVSGSLVRSYFSGNGLDVNALDGLVEQRPDYSALPLNSKATDYIFLTDLNDGDVFLYNPLTQSGKEIYSFDRQITDIAVDDAGNIYVSDFYKVYKYDIASNALTILVDYTIGSGINSLAINGDLLYTASGNNNLLVAFDKNTGQIALTKTLDGGYSAGDIAFIGDAIFRTTVISGVVEQYLDGTPASSTLSSATNSGFWGLTVTADNDLWAVASWGQIIEIDTATGSAATVANSVNLVGLTSISGAAEAQPLHLQLFL